MTASPMPVVRVIRIAQRPVRVPRAVMVTPAWELEACDDGYAGMLAERAMPIAPERAPAPVAVMAKRVRNWRPVTMATPMRAVLVTPIVPVRVAVWFAAMDRHVPS